MISDIEVNKILLEPNPETTNKLEVIRAYINKRKSIDTGQIIQPQHQIQEFLMNHCFNVAKQWFLENTKV